MDTFLFLALLMYACYRLARQQRRLCSLEARQRKREDALLDEIIRHQDAAFDLAEENAALTVMYSEAAAAGIDLAEQNAELTTLLTEVAIACNAWESHALAYEVLSECLYENDRVGARNAAKEAASSRQNLRDLGEYDA